MIFWIDSSNGTAIFSSRFTVKNLMVFTNWFRLFAIPESFRIRFRSSSVYRNFTLPFSTISRAYCVAFIPNLSAFSFTELKSFSLSLRLIEQESFFFFLPGSPTKNLCFQFIFIFHSFYIRIIR